MTDKQMDIGQCPYEGECQLCKSACSVDVYCFIKQLFNERNIAEEQLYLKNKECEELKEKLSRKKAVIDFASCPSYGYRDNDIEPTCTKTFCYDIESCEYKTMIKYEQTLTEIQDEARDGYCSGTQTGCEKSLQQILQKCEVLNNEFKI